MQTTFEKGVIESSLRPRDVSYVLGELLVITLLLLAFVVINKILHFRRPKHASVSAGGCPFSPLTCLEDGRALKDASPHNKQPFKLPLLKPITSPHLTMGLRRLDNSNWLTIDHNYLPEHRIRADLLEDHTSDVLQCLPGSETACQEVLSKVAAFLTARYPAAFSVSGDMIVNRMTGERFLIANNPNPLEAAARLAMEDFNILVKDPDDDEYHLQASATLFPAGWKLQDRVGGTTADLHRPVPNWRRKLGCSVNRYFDHLSQTTAMERHPLFVQTSPLLFQSESLPSLPPSPKTSFVNLPSLAATPYPVTLPALPEDIYVRRERQTFTPLTLSSSVSGHKTILFTVHTFLAPLTSLALSELDALLQTADAWPKDSAAYKGREAWIGTLREYKELRSKAEVNVV